MALVIPASNQGGRSPENDSRESGNLELETNHIWHPPLPSHSTDVPLFTGAPVAKMSTSQHRRSPTLHTATPIGTTDGQTSQRQGSYVFPFVVDGDGDDDGDDNRTWRMSLDASLSGSDGEDDQDRNHSGPPNHLYDKEHSGLKKCTQCGSWYEDTWQYWTFHLPPRSQAQVEKCIRCRVRNRLNLRLPPSRASHTLAQQSQGLLECLNWFRILTDRSTRENVNIPIMGEVFSSVIDDSRIRRLRQQLEGLHGEELFHRARLQSLLSVLEEVWDRGSQLSSQSTQPTSQSTQASSQPSPVTDGIGSNPHPPPPPPPTTTTTTTTTTSSTFDGPVSPPLRPTLPPTPPPRAAARAPRGGYRPRGPRGGKGGRTANRNPFLRRRQTSVAALRAPSVPVPPASTDNFVSPRLPPLRPASATTSIMTGEGASSMPHRSESGSMSSSSGDRFISKTLDDFPGFFSSWPERYREALKRTKGYRLMMRFLEKGAAMEGSGPDSNDEWRRAIQEEMKWKRIRKEHERQKRLQEEEWINDDAGQLA